MNTATLQDSHVRQPSMRPLSPAQTRAVSGGKPFLVLVMDEHGALRIEHVYHPYPPTFPIKDLGASEY